MTAPQSDRSGTPALNPVVVFGVLALVLALRAMHLSSALQSPLSYQPGPDEDYYLRFGQAVASGRGQDSPEFTFMDPGYGYLLGALFKLVGVNPVAVYLFQALLDTATAYGILCIGRLLNRPRAGLYGALLYGLVSTAIMFCATLLKEICVASYLTWWVAGALAVCRSERKLAWLGFGLLCGIGTALRSTLLLSGVAALLLPALAGKRSGRVGKAALVVLGIALSLAPWSLRNHGAFGSFSPLPTNGGIVLHQAYNAQNPASAIWIPAFVNYLNPSEIWRGYAAEAERRVGQPLTPPQVDGYWREEAVQFMRDHPRQVIEDVARKGVAFLSATEVPNNRSATEERLFSPVLHLLPPPSAWLLASGLAGLVWFAIADRRWPVVALPIVISWATVAVFWAEDRFRFHAAPVLALCAGVWIDGLVQSVRTPGRWQLPVFSVLAAAIAAASLYLGTQFPPPAVRWDHIVWGYIKMGKPAEAQSLAARIAIEQPDNGPVFEALGYLAATTGKFDDAQHDYQRAVELRPRSYLAHYNLAKVLLALGDKTRAAAEARTSLSLRPSADTEALLTQIESTR
jgi:4-amino-4-deoxy-L-arabinose transferase-like glycosyltransferase